MHAAAVFATRAPTRTARAVVGPPDPALSVVTYKSETNAIVLIKETIALGMLRAVTFQALHLVGVFTFGVFTFGVAVAGADIYTLRVEVIHSRTAVGSSLR
jgi:hypothetical protein